MCWRDDKAFNAAKIQLFCDTAKFFAAFITFATVKKLQKKAGRSSRISLPLLHLLFNTYNFFFAISFILGRKDKAFFANLQINIGNVELG